MPKKILVAYGSSAGSTAEAADFIGGILAESSALVDVKPVEKIRNVTGYDEVVIGTNIRAGHIKGSVKNFVNRNKKALQNIPVALFVVCLTMKDDTPENRKKVSEWLGPIRAHIKPIDEGLFAGKVELAKLGFFARFIFENMAKMKDHDYRDWEKVKSWAVGLSGKL
jgi:menaquinone-dependent protoporphyrinogen oxidase